MDDTSNPPLTQNPFSGVTIEITVSVGRARPKIKDLLTMDENTIMVLDRKVEDPVELFVGDKLIARGELEEAEGDQQGKLAVRLTEVADFNSALE